MQTLEGVKLIKEIEQKFDVMSIKWKGVSVWPFLRLYLKESITTQRENKASSSNIKLVLKCLFSYNPIRALKRHVVWAFTACDRRKLIGEKKVHRISGALAAENCLMIEKPLKGLGHYSRNEIEEKDIISEAWLLMIFHALEILSRWFNPKLENEDILKHILSENNLKFNYLRYVRMLNAQRVAMRLMLKLTPKPKVAMMECPYDTMGYMWAFHEVGVKVVEMQHGSLNGNHIAYNGNAYEPRMNPDCICVFGEDEYNYFVNDEPQFAPEVRMTGLYMLERANQYFSEDIFKRDRDTYKAIVVVAGQPVYEEKLSKFVDSLAAEHHDLLFVYIPRKKRDDLNFDSDNVRLVHGVNIYEYLKWADIHMTITSTTGLESQYFRTPTIFYDDQKIASRYFKGVLNESNGVRFVETPEQFTTAFDDLYEQSFSYREIFAHHHVERIKEVIEENLK